MATTTKKKKVIVKRKTTATASKPSAKKTIPVAVSEVFSTSTEHATPVTVSRDSVLLLVNGRDKGQIETGSQSLGDFVKSQAQAYGIRTFSVYVDGAKTTTSDSKKSLAQVAKLEIVAKDARG